VQHAAVLVVGLVDRPTRGEYGELHATNSNS
jgi:hypothetical protein